MVGAPSLLQRTAKLSLVVHTLPARPMRLHTMALLTDMLQKAKLLGQKTNHWWPGAGGGGKVHYTGNEVIAGVLSILFG